MKRVKTTASRFAYSKVGELCKELHCLPLTRIGYYYRSDGVENLLSLASVLKTHRVYTDTDVDNVLYVYNRDGTYVRFGLCKGKKLYILDIGITKPELSLSHTMVEDRKSKILIH